MNAKQMRDACAALVRGIDAQTPGLLNLIFEAIAAQIDALPVPESDGWMPIESAPKDLTILIGKYFDGIPGFNGGESYWMWMASGSFSADGEMHIDVVDENISQKFYQAPTHFKLLDKTPPPADAAKQGE